MRHGKQYGSFVSLVQGSTSRMCEKLLIGTHGWMCTLPSGRVGPRHIALSEASDIDSDDDVVRHADLDDSVRHLQHPVILDWGAKLERPKGTEWKERVCHEFNGDVHGGHLHVEMNRRTEVITKVSRSRFIPIRSEGVSVQTIFSSCLSGNDVQRRQRSESRIIEPTQLLVSSAPSRLARIALAAVELQGLKYGSNSSCYLPRAPDGRGSRHIASIPSSVFSGNDVYYRKRQGCFLAHSNEKFESASRS